MDRTQRWTNHLERPAIEIHAMVQWPRSVGVWEIPMLQLMQQLTTEPVISTFFKQTPIFCGSQLYHQLQQCKHGKGVRQKHVNLTPLQTHWLYDKKMFHTVVNALCSGKFNTVVNLLCHVHTGICYLFAYFLIEDIWNTVYVFRWSSYCILRVAVHVCIYTYTSKNWDILGLHSLDFYFTELCDYYPGFQVGRNGLNVHQLETSDPIYEHCGGRW